MSDRNGVETQSWQLGLHCCHLCRQLKVAFYTFPFLEPKRKKEELNGWGVVLTRQKLQLHTSGKQGGWSRGRVLNFICTSDSSSDSSLLCFALASLVWDHFISFHFISFHFISFRFVFIYFKREKEEQREWEGERENPKQAPVRGSNSRTMRSWPELKLRVGCLTNWTTQVPQAMSL